MLMLFLQAKRRAVLINVLLDLTNFLFELDWWETTLPVSCPNSFLSFFNKSGKKLKIK